METTWILIANGSEARLFSLDQRRTKLELLKEFLHPQSRMKQQDLTTDRPGRWESGQLGKGIPYGDYAEPTEPKEHEMERFAHQLVEELEAGRTGNRFSEVVVFAPPHFHGLLNKRLSDPLRSMVSHHVEKDYTDVREHDLLGRIAPHLL